MHLMWPGGPLCLCNKGGCIPALIIELQQFLTPLVRPRYRVAVERRAYLALLAPDDLVGRPDVSLVDARQEPAATMTDAALAESAPLVAELPMPEEVIERYLELRDVVTGEVITVIEILVGRPGPPAALDSERHTGRPEPLRKPKPTLTCTITRAQL